MAFDGGGSLWLSDAFLHRVDAASLASSNPTATALGIVGSQPVFNKSGDLFYVISDYVAGDTSDLGVYKISAADLAAQNYSNRTFIAASDFSTFLIGRLAFSASGDLYMSGMRTSNNTSTVGLITADQIASVGVNGNGPVAPTLLLNTSGFNPAALAFDPNGNLYIAETETGNILMMTPEQRAAQTPGYTTVVTGAGVFPTNMYFAPIAAGAENAPEPGSVVLLLSASAPVAAGMARRRRRAA